MKTLVSFFSGIGGLDEGLHQAGFYPLFLCEIDPNARASLRRWLDQKCVGSKIAENINDIESRNLANTLGLLPGELDLLAGGPPCQSFSLIGKRKSLSDARGLLLFKMIEFAKHLKPKAVLIEQVKGLLSAKGSDGRKGSAVAFVLNELEKLGYNVDLRVLRAADYGVAQLRDRVFILAMRGASKVIWPKQTHYDWQNGQRQMFGDKYLTLRDVIGDLPTPVARGEIPAIANHIDVTPQRDRQRICGVPEGQCLAKQLHLPKDQRQRLNPKKDTTKFRRLAWNLPALTLRGGETFYHPTEDRYLTPREYLRIHGYSDSRVLCGPIRARSGTFRNLDQHRQIANSVPPPVAYQLGRAIVDQL